MNINIKETNPHTNFKRGDLVKHRNGGIGIITNNPDFNDELRIALLQHSSKYSNNSMGTWNKKQCTYFNGTITLTQ